MIVLRIDVSGHSADVRWAGAEAVVGSGASAAIQRDDADWAAREAVLVHLGGEVLVVRSNGSGERRLKVGDSVRLGAADVTLVGLLPLQPELEGDEARGPASPAYFATPEAAGTAIQGEDSPPVEAAAPSDWVPTLAEDAVPAASGGTSAPTTPEPAAPTPPTEASGKAALAADARWRQGTFEDELVATLKRSPWFALSAVIHAALFGLLIIFGGVDRDATQERPHYGIVSANSETPDATEESGGPKELSQADLAPEEYAAPDADDPAAPDASSETPRSTPDSSATAPEPETPSSEPPVIGVSRSMIALRTKPKAAPEKAAKPASPGDDWVNRDTDRALEVNQKAAARVRDDIRRGGGALGAALKGLKREDILVVRGNFDHMETVLEELKIPYTLASPNDLFTQYDFDRHKLVFWNCMDPESSLPRRYRPMLVSALREFVRGGGFLFTTDWSISSIVAPAFPGYLESSGGLNPLPEMILDVLPTRAERENPILEGVFPETDRVKWWLEQASQDVQVARGAKVEVLIESKELSGLPKPRSPVIAATFSYGKGRVLHVMGHYYQQKGNLAGAAGAQRLALNFVKMRVDKDKPAVK